MDDEEWCRRTAVDLSLGGLSFPKEVYGPKTHGLEAKGDSARLGNPALVPLVKRVLAYKDVDGVALVLEASRLALHLYKPINARVDGGIMTSQQTRQRNSAVWRGACRACLPGWAWCWA